MALQFEPLPDTHDERVLPVVTDLWRTTQPIIRYRLNDVLQLATQACVCGSPWRVLHAIEGRCDDICYFASRAGGTHPYYSDTIRRMILLASQEITDCQVIQQHPGELSISLAIAPGASSANIVTSVPNSVQTTIAHYDCLPASVEITQGITPFVPGLKRRRVQRLEQVQG